MENERVGAQPVANSIDSLLHLLDERLAILSLVRFKVALKNKIGTLIFVQAAAAS